MCWRRKEPGHQQPWYLLSWTGIIHSFMWSLTFTVHPIEYAHGFVVLCFVVVALHDDIITWKHFLHFWPLWGESNSDWLIPLTKGQWCRSLIFLDVSLNKMGNQSSGQWFAVIILWMRPANERRHYIVMLSLIGWAHAQNDPWIWAAKTTMWHHYND